MTNLSNTCGLDFGTSNSTCAIVENNNVRLVSLEQEKVILPSALFFSNGGNITFGREAINNYIDGEEGRLLRGLKSILGTSLMSDKTAVGRQSISFEDILSIFIDNIKNKAELSLDDDLHNVVMGRPVHFHDNDPDADKKSENVLRQIALNIGFKNVSFQYEPIAAAYAHEQKLDNDKIAIVIDLGGGTSDFTVIKLSPTKLNKYDRRDDILATTGIRVGGTNFDKSLSMTSFMPHLGLGSGYHSSFEKAKILTVPSKIYNDLSYWPFIYQAQTRKSIMDTQALLRTANEPIKIKRLLTLQENQLGHALLQSVEQTKINLTDIDDCTTNLMDIGLDFMVKTNRNDFIQSIETLITRIEFSLEECLVISECKKSDIDLVILTGGSSELPIISTMVKNNFPDAEISKDDKFGSVGRGLAYSAANILKA